MRFRSTLLIFLIVLGLGCTRKVRVAHKDGVNVRAEHSADAPILATIPFETVIVTSGEWSPGKGEIIPCSGIGPWLRTTYNGSEGWIFAPFTSTPHEKHFFQTVRGCPLRNPNAHGNVCEDFATRAIALAADGALPGNQPVEIQIADPGILDKKYRFVCATHLRSPFFEPSWHMEHSLFCSIVSFSDASTARAYMQETQRLFASSEFYQIGLSNLVGHCHSEGSRIRSIPMEGLIESVIQRWGKQVL